MNFNEELALSGELELTDRDLEMVFGGVALPHGGGYSSSYTNSYGGSAANYSSGYGSGDEYAYGGAASAAYSDGIGFTSPVGSAGAGYNYATGYGYGGGR